MISVILFFYETRFSLSSHPHQHRNSRIYQYAHLVCDHFLALSRNTLGLHDRNARRGLSRSESLRWYLVRLTRRSQQEEADYARIISYFPLFLFDLIFDALDFSCVNLDRYVESVALAFYIDQHYRHSGGEYSYDSTIHARDPIDSRRWTR